MSANWTTAPAIARALRGSMIRWWCARRAAFTTSTWQGNVRARSNKDWSIRRFRDAWNLKRGVHSSLENDVSQHRLKSPVQRGEEETVRHRNMST